MILCLCFIGLLVLFCFCLRCLEVLALVCASVYGLLDFCDFAVADCVFLVF